MKKSQNSYIIHGIINIVMHIPMLIATSIWGLLIIGTCNLDTIAEPHWYVVSMLPWLIPTISCTVGTIRGILNAKNDKKARLCLILSIIGFFIYIGLTALCAWFGSMY